MVYLGKGAWYLKNEICSFVELPAVSVHGWDSGAQLDKNDLVLLVFLSNFRHDGGEHCRVFSQRGSCHSPQRRNQREHVMVSPLSLSFQCSRLVP